MEKKHFDPEQVLEKARRMVREGEVNLHGRHELNNKVIAEIEEHTKILRQFIAGLKFGDELDNSDLYLIDEYVGMVKRRISDLYQIRARARRKGISSFEMYTIGKAEKHQTMWQISGELQEMVGWLLEKGIWFRPGIFRRAGDILRYHSAAELRLADSSTCFYAKQKARHSTRNSEFLRKKVLR